MADEQKNRGRAADDLAEATGESAVGEVPESGRALTIDSSPEGRLMQVGTLDTGAPAEEAEARQSKVFEKIDDRAANEARMDVRRREASAD